MQTLEISQASLEIKNDQIDKMQKRSHSQTPLEVKVSQTPQLV